MKKAIIIDDERLARVELKAHLSHFPEINIVAEASNADEGIQLIGQWQPDLIFLDIQMPERNGFDLLEEIDETPQVIFTTAYDEYAIKAFEFNALDYLLKPIKRDRLTEALNKVFNQKEKDSFDPEQEVPPMYKELVYIKDGSAHHFIRLAEVSMFSSYGNYVKVHSEGITPLVHRSLNQIEARLDDKLFFRANRFTIINLRQIESIGQSSRGKLKVVLKNGQQVELSERKSILFRESWGI